MFRTVFSKFILILSFLFAPLFSHAEGSVSLNEIMYNPEGSDTNHEWVEIYNNGNEAIDIASWYFWEGNTYHGLHPDGFTQLQPGEYALIVKDVPIARSELGASHHYIRASFSLGNTGETLKIADENKTTISELHYLSDWGANGNGNSLQYISGQWKEGDPTPGEQNEIVSSENTDSQNNEEDSDSEKVEGNTIHEGANLHSKYSYTVSRFLQKLIAGEEFKARILVKHEGDKVYDGLFLVNFGDGTIIKTREPVKEYTHRYIHPGKYLFVFEYYPSSLIYDARDDPEISFRKIIEVDKSETLSLEKVNPYDGVVIRNNGNDEVNLEEWKLRWKGKWYTFPHGTILLPHEVLRISFKAVGFSPFPTRRDKISLISNANVVVTTYPAPLQYSQRVRKRAVVSIQKKNTSPYSRQKETSEQGVSVDFDTLPSHLQEKGEIPFQDYLEKHPGKVLVDFSQEQEEGKEKNEASPFGEIIPLVLAFFLTVISSLIAIVSFSRKEDASVDRKEEENAYHIELIDD